MTRHQRAASSGGFTLIGMLVTLTLLGVVVGPTLSVVISIQRSFVQKRDWVRSQESLRAAQMTIATVLRSAGADPGFSGQTLLDPDPLNHGTFDNLRVVSDFNPADGDVLDPLEDFQIWLANDTLWVRFRAGDAPQAIVAPIQTLEFEYYANDGTQLTVSSQVGGATRVRFVIDAPRAARSRTHERIETQWVHLRNRN